MFRLIVLLVVISTGALLHADPVRPFVDRAKYIMHLKVVGIEEPTEVLSRDGDELTYGPEHAVCDVKEILLGMVATDEWGRVRLSCVSRKNTVHLSTEVRYAVGDEVTLIADACELDPRRGMIFDGGGHPNRRAAGPPTQDIRDLIFRRAEAAQVLAEALEKLAPGATAEVEKALDEFEARSRKDFKDITPKADLLLDIVAMARYTPDVGDLKRPTLDAATRATFTRMALQALCGLSAAGAEIAASAVEGKGNGAYALLRPAAGDAVEVLRKLADRAEFTGFANHLLRHDFEHRALGLVCKLAADSGPSAELAQWALIEAVEGGWVGFADVDKRLAPERSSALPYDSASQRAVASALDKRATRLAAWLVMRQGATLTGSDKVAGNANVVATHTKKAADLFSLTEMLQVYAYALAVQGADAEHVKAARAEIEKKRSDKLDLTDISEVEWELKKKNAVPAALRGLVRNSKTKRR